MDYTVSIKRVKNQESNLKGFAEVVLGKSFKITNIAILENRNGGLFVSMPSYKSQEVDEHNRQIYKDLCNPITKEFRDDLYGVILDTYQNVNQSQNRNSTLIEVPDFTVKMTPFERESSNIRGIGRICFENQFVVSNVLVLQGKDKLFVSMPNYRTNQVDKENRPIYQDVCYPITKQFREILYGEILKSYQKEKEKKVIDRSMEEQQQYQGKNTMMSESQVTSR